MYYYNNLYNILKISVLPTKKKNAVNIYDGLAMFFREEINDGHPAAILLSCGWFLCVNKLFVIKKF